MAEIMERIGILLDRITDRTQRALDALEGDPGPIPWQYVCDQVSGAATAVADLQSQVMKMMERIVQVATAMK